MWYNKIVMGLLTKEQAIFKANEAFRRYYGDEIDVTTCYGIVLDREVRSKLNGWKAPDPWDVLGRPGEVTKDPTKSKSDGERRAIRRQKADLRKRFVPFKKI